MGTGVGVRRRLGRSLVLAILVAVAMPAASASGAWISTETITVKPGGIATSKSDFGPPGKIYKVVAGGSIKYQPPEPRPDYQNNGAYDPFYLYECDPYDSCPGDWQGEPPVWWPRHRVGPDDEVSESVITQAWTADPYQRPPYNEDHKYVFYVDRLDGHLVFQDFFNQYSDSPDYDTSNDTGKWTFEFFEQDEQRINVLFKKPDPELTSVAHGVKVLTCIDKADTLPAGYRLFSFNRYNYYGLPGTYAQWNKAKHEEREKMERRVPALEAGDCLRFTARNPTEKPITVKIFAVLRNTFVIRIRVQPRS